MRTIRGFRRISLIICSLLMVGILAFGWFLQGKYVVPILMYHSIRESSPSNKLVVSPGSFERQMDFLRRRKYNIVSLDELVDLITSHKRISPKTLAITFDDGYKDNYTNAYPVLEKYRVPATIFVVTDWVGKEGFLKWDEVIQMAGRRISIGSHTISHPWLPDLDEAHLRKEVGSSKEILEQRIGTSVHFISYPVGGFNEQVKKIVREAGYKGACTTDPGEHYPSCDPYALKRIRISSTSDNLFVFWIKTTGYYTWIKEIRDED